jgi:hypothetical protein
MNFKVSWRLFLLVFSLGLIGKLTSPVLAQDSLAFKKHSFIQNTLTGHKWGLEIPIELSRISTSDFDYEGTDGINPNLIGVSIKATLKNDWGRGISFGVGIDYTTSNYFRLNIPLDLDFLIAYSLRLSPGELGKKSTRFTVNMLSKFVFSKILATVDGVRIQEYYMRFNVFHMQFNRVAFSWGPTFGLFRKTYAPHFAEKGTWWSLSYIFNK